MSSSTPNFLSIADRLGLSADQFTKREWQLLCLLRVALPCVVQHFDPVKQTVDVVPVIREQLNMIQDGVPVPTPSTIPLLQGLPIIALGGGGWSVTLPIAAGDECLAIFADLCIDSWFQSGGANNTELYKRRHGLSDGFAIVGVRSNPHAIASYSTNAVEVRNAAGTTKLRIEPDLITLVAANVKVQGSLEVTGNAQIDGNLDVDGTAEIDGTATIDGKTFLTHQHTGVATGGGNSGGVL